MPSTMETEYSEELQRRIAAEQGSCNLLIDPLPTHVTVGGRDYLVNSNFRTWALFEVMLTDSELSDQEIVINALQLCFSKEIPTDVEAAFEALIWFYRCGIQEKPKRRRRKAQEPEQAKLPDQRVFDLNEDAPLIYAAFMSQYGIDLQDIEYLHWWKFSAMLQGLHDDERIVEIMGYRGMDLKEIKDKEMRRRYARLKEKYALPDVMTQQQKVDMAGNVFSGGA